MRGIRHRDTHLKWLTYSNTGRLWVTDDLDFTDYVNTEQIIHFRWDSRTWRETTEPYRTPHSGPGRSSPASPLPPNLLPLWSLQDVQVTHTSKKNSIQPQCIHFFLHVNFSTVQRWRIYFVLSISRFQFINLRYFFIFFVSPVFFVLYSWRTNLFHSGHSIIWC